MKFAAFRNYVRLFQDPLFWKSLGNTFYVGLIAHVFILLGGLVLAYILNTKLIKYPNIFKTIYFLPMVTSAVATGIVFKAMFGMNAGIINLFISSLGFDKIDWWGGTGAYIKPAIIIMFSWKWIGWNMVIYPAGMQGISTDIYEAATIDGANHIQVFFRITIPLLRPIILFILIQSTIGTLNLFTEPFILLGGGSLLGGTGNQGMTVMMYLLNKAPYGNNHYCYASATAYVMCSIIIIASLINMKISGSFTLLVLLFCSMGGYAFAIYMFPGRDLLFGVLIVTMMIPWTAGIIPWFFMMSRFGWINNFPALIIPNSANAFGIFWMRQYCRNNVPHSLIDAAKIDGLSEWLSFFKIIAPILVPGFAALGVVRMAEFAWTRIEPQEGEFRFEWLERAINLLGQYGVKTILGTPTPTPPRLDYRKTSEILPINSKGVKAAFGGRHHNCQSNRTYRSHAVCMLEAFTSRFKDNPHVVGWQTDNELGNSYEDLCHCPLLLLDWKRFHSDLICDFQKFQIDILRKNCPGQIITHNFMGFFDIIGLFQAGGALGFHQP